MEFPSAADAEAEALFTHEGGAAVLNVCARTGAVPVEGGGEGGGGFSRIAFEVIDRAGRDRQMGGFSTALIAVGAIGQRPTGHWQ